MATTDSIELRVVTIFGLSVQINVAKDLSVTIGELKQKIAKSKIGSNPDEQIICFNNQEIFSNNQTLKGKYRSEFKVFFLI